MSFKKYQNAMKAFLVYVIFFAIIGIIFLVAMSDALSPVIPTERVGSEMMILFLLIFPLLCLRKIIARKR